ncbi:MAG: nuclear transport factor 2 family protein [Dehalococcoidales bacterium]|jgi:hypothetical protein
MTQKGLDAKVAALEKELTRLKDIEAIRKLEHAYSYYLVMWLPDEIIALFSERDDTTLEWPEGTFFGKDGLQRFFGRINTGKDPEFMHQMMHLTDVIDISEDGLTGQGRWWGFGAMALVAPGGGIMQALACGIYENEFIKEDGIWKLWKIKWVPVYSATPATGWVKPERIAKPQPPREGEEGNVGDWWQPDKPAKGIPYSYPSGYILPFHFKHPVTGKNTAEEKRNRKVKGAKK